MLRSIFFIFFFVFGSIFLEAQTINSVFVANDVIGLYDKFEIELDINASYDNPFDYSQVNVQATVQRPSGAIDIVDGFYTENIKIDPVTGQSSVDGDPLFKIRYAPMELGDHIYQVTLTDINGTVSSSSFNFQSVENTSENRGFVKSNSSLYLQFDDGDQYIPIGENMAWQSNNIFNNYQLWLSGMAENQGNFIRLWHAHWGLGIEWLNGWSQHKGLKAYNQYTSAYQDWLYEYCMEKGIYVMLTLQHHGQVSTQVNPNWDSNPYNQANGGPCTNTWDFFTNQEAKELTKNRLRYIVARWGYARSIMCWELFNEVEWTDNFDFYQPEIVAWHVEMAQYLESIDIYQHTISTSLANDVGDGTLWDSPEFDFTQVHYYGNVPNIHETLENLSHKHIDEFNKPNLLGEFGIASGNLIDLDPDGIHIHNGMWASMLGGSLGTAMPWFWDNYVEPQNLYVYFNALHQVAGEVPFLEKKLRPKNVEVMGAMTDLFLYPSLNWGLIGDEEISISSNGQIDPINIELSTFLYGDEFNTQFKAPPTFQVNYPGDGIFAIKTSNQMGTNARIVIRLDGTTLIDEVAQLNKEYKIGVDKGAHTIEVDNNGTDWLGVEYYFFTGLSPKVHVSCVMSENQTAGAGWVLNKDYNHQNLAAGNMPDPVNDAVLILDNVLDNSVYHVRWFECLEGDEIESIDITSADNRLQIPIPELMWDMSFIVESDADVAWKTVEKPKVKIYPNPIVRGGELNIDSDGDLKNAELTIYNAQGQRMTRIDDFDEVSQILSMDPSWVPGLYWLHMTQGSKTYVESLVIVE